MGFINPMLYKKRRKVVRDILPQATAPILSPRYDNGVDPTGGTSWFGVTLDRELQTLHTTMGYDNATGLGVPRALLHTTLRQAREISSCAELAPGPTGSPPAPLQLRRDFAKVRSDRLRASQVCAW